MKHILSGFGDDEDDLLAVEDVLAEDGELKMASSGNSTDEIVVLGW
jgi:hypothetical protein